MWHNILQRGVKIIIIDFNQVCISNVMAQIGNHTNLKLEEDLVRHMILNKIRQIRQKFKDGGTIVIACDGKNNWRKQFFPNYKANRKKARDSSDFDWNNIFEILNKIKDELSENFPYIVIHVDRAEADDVIATLAIEHGVQLNSDIAEQIVIVSGDKDFVQLQQFANVKQYDPIGNKLITHSDPSLFIKHQVIKGDRGDGVPNILSGDDCLVTGERQKKITEKFLKEFPDDIETLPENVKRNFMRNQMMIDLAFIPKDIKHKTLEIFAEEKGKIARKRSKMFNYFVNNKLKNLIEHVGEF